MDELVREALQEGRLTVAGGGPAALYTPWAASFEKQYPGITVQVRGAFSNQLVAGIDRQLETGAPAVDVAICRRRRTSRGGRRRARCSRPTSRPRSTWRRTGATTTGATCRSACPGWATATTRARSPPGRSPGRPPGSPTRGGAAASSPPTRTKTTSRSISTACWPNGTAGRSHRYRNRLTGRWCLSQRLPPGQHRHGQAGRTPWPVANRWRTTAGSTSTPPTSREPFASREGAATSSRDAAPSRASPVVAPITRGSARRQPRDRGRPTRANNRRSGRALGMPT
jgi:hypothetical protein